MKRNNSVDVPRTGSRELTRMKMSLTSWSVCQALSVRAFRGGPAVAVALFALPMAVHSFPGVVNLSDLNGSDGFVINGIDGGDNSGFSVSGAGDINGDGVDDLIIGARDAGPNGNDKAGESYVLFGGSGVAGTGVVNLSDLDGTDGFVINGIDADDNSGNSVSGAGDINGDGMDDLIIGARDAGPNGNGYAGESYVLFGGSGVAGAGVVNLSDLDGTDGFVINGVDEGDESGNSVSGAGDINGDGVDDLIIGARFADPNGNDEAGESYVLFGGSGVAGAGVVNLSGLDGTDGFVINGIDADDESGISVSGAEDINGDGVDDLIIGAHNADPNGNDEAGESYVLFGGSGVAGTGVVNLSDLDGTDGFVINGADADDYSGVSVSGAGDINGDGVGDLIIAAYGAVPNGKNNAGESYVLFGGSGVAGVGVVNLSDLDATDGFVINGIDTADYSGVSMSEAGDVNGDGVDDLIIGADYADPNGNDKAGESYVLFGGSGVAGAGVVNLPLCQDSCRPLNYNTEGWLGYV